MDRSPNLILYYDGSCGLCHRFVQFLIQRDARSRLFYAPLQGQTAQTRLPEPDRPKTAQDLKSVILWDGNRFRYRSDGALQALSLLGGVWPALTELARTVPAPLRDLIYDWVARNRYRWFGRDESCPLPSPEQRARFLP